MFFLIELAIVVITIAGAWKAFEKAGRPGWAAVIPVYNVIVMLEIAGKPLWWIILFFIPIANIVIAILALLAFVEKYGQSALFAIGMVFLPFIFWPLLGFGDAQCSGPPPAPSATL